MTDLEKITEVKRCELSAKHFCFNHLTTENIETEKIEPFGTFNAWGDLPDNKYRKDIENLIDILQKAIDENDRDKIQDILTDKSRQMYITQTLCAVLGVWALLFRDNWRLGCTSKIEDDVDMSGNQNSLFEIMRGMINRLPVWLRPAPEDYTDNYMLISYKVRNSSIQGSASDECFRNSQVTCLWFDEFSYQPHGYQRYKASREAVKKFSVYTSTPNGRHNKFADLRFGKNKRVKVLSYHWSLRRTLEWYKKKCDEDYAGRDEDRASELDMSYEQSVRGRTFASFIAAKHVQIYNPIELKEKLRVCVRTNGYDFGFTHSSVTLFLGKDYWGNYILYDEVVTAGTPVHVDAQEVKRKMAQWEGQYRHYADPSGKQKRKESNGVTCYDLWRSEGIIFTDAENDVQIGINCINALFYKDKLMVSSTCVNAIDALQECQWHTNKNGEKIGVKYKDDWFTDIIDGLRYALSEAIKLMAVPKDEGQESMQGLKVVRSGGWSPNVVR
jgi:hypothetical protein